MCDSKTVVEFFVKQKTKNSDWSNNQIFPAGVDNIESAISAIDVAKKNDSLLPKALKKSFERSFKVVKKTSIITEEVVYQND